MPIPTVNVIDNYIPQAMPRDGGRATLVINGYSYNAIVRDVDSSHDRSMVYGSGRPIGMTMGTYTTRVTLELDMTAQDFRDGQRYRSEIQGQWSDVEVSIGGQVFTGVQHAGTAFTTVAESDEALRARLNQHLAMGGFPAPDTAAPATGQALDQLAVFYGIERERAVTPNLNYVAASIAPPEMETDEELRARVIANLRRDDIYTTPEDVHRLSGQSLDEVADNYGIDRQLKTPPQAPPAPTAKAPLKTRYQMIQEGL